MRFTLLSLKSYEYVVYVTPIAVVSMNIGSDYHYSPCIDSEASVIDYTSHR